MKPSNTGRITRIALAVLAVLAVYTVFTSLNWLPDWTNPFAEQTKDRSGPVLLKSIRDLSRYEAATGQFQVVVDLEKDASYLPDSVKGNRTLFVGNGTVDAYVDFSKLTDKAITVDKDRTTVTITLPPAALEPTNLDPKKSYVFATQRGILDRVGGFFSSNPNDQQKLYILASAKILQAANESGLKDRADKNTKMMLENLLKALGFKTVNITTSAPAQ
jgi:hypothetical protein